VFQSEYFDLDAEIGTNVQSATVPALSGEDLALQQTYDSTDTIPFLAIGARFMHSGSPLVNPGVFRANGSINASGYSYAMVEQDLAEGNTTLSNSALPAQCWIEALLSVVLYDEGTAPPAPVLLNPTVSADISAIDSSRG
jgi:hypothetical protein